MITGFTASVDQVKLALETSASVTLSVQPAELPPGSRRQDPGDLSGRGHLHHMSGREPHDLVGTLSGLLLVGGREAVVL